MKKLKNTKTPNIKKRIIELDVLFGKYIKLKHSDYKGYCNCVTCGKILKLGTQDLQAGHFVRRGNYSLRWNEFNVHPQCARCNKYLSGNEIAHAEYIIDTYGLEVFKELMEVKRQINKRPKIKEIEELILYYENKIEGLNG